jgi:hypothetical protein
MATKHYPLASDFDQTLSFNDSGLVLAEFLGVHGFENKVAELARNNLVQQGGDSITSSGTTPTFVASGVSISLRPAVVCA